MTKIYERSKSNSFPLTANNLEIGQNYIGRATGCTELQIKGKLIEKTVGYKGLLYLIFEKEDESKTTIYRSDGWRFFKKNDIV